MMNKKWIAAGIAAAIIAVVLGASWWLSREKERPVRKRSRSSSSIAAAHRKRTRPGTSAHTHAEDLTHSC